MAVGAFAVVVAAVVVVPVAVYAMVRGEHDREVMDRRDAERAARRDTRGRD